MVYSKITKGAIAPSAITQDALQPSATTLDNMIATGSVNTSADSSGYHTVAHGLATIPAIAHGVPVSSAGTVGDQRINIKAAGATNVTFAAVSVPVNTVAATKSSFTSHFVWAAHL